MRETVCLFADRDEAIVAYLYDEGGDPAARATFDAHLATCARCASEVAALRGVRAQLGQWHPPGFASIVDRPPQAAGRGWWQIPAWAQVAAALLFLGVAAGIANLDVRYDANGLSVRTGWSRDARAASVAAAPAPVPGTASQASLAPAAGTDAAPWRGDLAALERQLKTEFHGVQSAAASSPRAGSDAELLRRVRALIEDSERRQQRELALRLAETIRDVNAQRQADLVKVDRVLGNVQNNLGIQVLKNRAQMQQMDYLIRTSQR